MIVKAFKNLERTSKSTLLIFSIALVLLIGFLDYITGREFAFSVFYLFPVSIVAWFISKRAALVMSFMSSTEWFIADLLSNPQYSNFLIPHWNTAVRFGFFVIVTLVLSELKKKTEFDNKLAREIQLDLLPKILPESTRYETALEFQPADTVSGDYIDILQYDENSLGICIADAVGHGISAALLMSNMQSAFRMIATQETPSHLICSRLNQAICANIAPSRFITFFYGALDFERKEFNYTNAGHFPPILLRNSGTHLFLDTDGIMLGVKQEEKYDTKKIEIQTGDRLVLYTDGVLDVTNSFGQMFGKKRLVELLSKNYKMDAAELCRTIKNAINNFGKNNFPDDASLLIVSIN
jgi:serine phosphatase RsbU (regulator of sigma subunit)